MQTKYLILVCISFFIYTDISAQYREDDWEERDRWMDVKGILDLAGVKKGSQVADVGCHEGYLSIHLANRVGEEGKVYAVDVRQNRLDALNRHLKDRKLDNVQTILGDYDNPKLPEELLDVVIVMDTYHEMDDYMEILEHLKRSLKPGGKILILEKLKDYVKNKSRKTQTNAHTLSMNYVKEELKTAGFTISKEVNDFGIWNNEEDKKIWILVAVKQ